MPRTIRGILLLAMLSILLPSVLLEVVLHVQRFETRRFEEQQANLEIARVVAANFDHFLQELLHHEEAVGSSITSARDLDQIRFVLDTEAAEHLAVSCFFWADAQGQVLAHSSGESAIHRISHQRFLDELLDGSDWTISEVQVEAPDGPVFAAARAVRSGGALRGIIGGIVDVTRLGDMLHVERIGGGVIAVYDRAGKAVLTHPSHQLDRDLLQDHGLNWAEGAVTGAFRSRAGREYLGALAPIPMIHWTVEASRPTDEAMAAEVRDTINEAILYTVVAILATVIAFGVSRGLTIPLRRLRSHALAIGGGQLERQVAIDRPEELAELAQAFNRMAKEITVREDDLREQVSLLEWAQRELQMARDELEAVVQDRTADLAASEERLRSVMQTAVDAIILVDTRDQIVFWNRGAENIFGYRPSEIIRRPVQTLVPERQRDACTNLIRMAAGGGAATRDGQPVEVTGVRKDGTEFPSELSLGAFSSGGQVYVTGILRDITRRKQNEAALHEHMGRLRSTLERSVQAMAVLVETRDPYTAGHQRRVADLASAIAQDMGLSGEQVMVVRLASAVHDIGKVAVPSEVLVKPGRITEWEMDLIKVHPQTGYEILKTIEFPWPIAEIVRQHHERIDGSGYPRGLAGEAILLEARIIAVADVVEAMASFRPYRPAIGLDEALREVTEDHAQRYDAEVVAVCCRVLRGGRLGWT